MTAALGKPSKILAVADMSDTQIAIETARALAERILTVPTRVEPKGTRADRLVASLRDAPRARVTVASGL